MANPTNMIQLRISRKSIEVGVKTLMEGITQPYRDSKNIGTNLWGLQDLFRHRAILKYLLEADIQGFFEDMNRSVLTYHTLLHAWHQDMDVSESRINASTYEPMICAIVTGNYEMLKLLDKLMPEKMGDYDGAVVFAYTTFLRTIVKSDRAETEDAFHAFSGECKGFLNYRYKIQVLEGVVANDEDLFNSGLESYLDSFNATSAEEMNEMAPGEIYINLEALAYIQLAKRAGLKVSVTHGMIPPALQQAQLILPDTGYPEWPG